MTADLDEIIEYQELHEALAKALRGGYAAEKNLADALAEFDMWTLLLLCGMESLAGKLAHHVLASVEDAAREKLVVLDEPLAVRLLQGIKDGIRDAVRSGLPHDSKHVSSRELRRLENVAVDRAAEYLLDRFPEYAEFVPIWSRAVASVRRSRRKKKRV